MICIIFALYSITSTGVYAREWSNLDRTKYCARLEEYFSEMFKIASSTAWNGKQYCLDQSNWNEAEDTNLSWVMDDEEWENFKGTISDGLDKLHDRFEPRSGKQTGASSWNKNENVIGLFCFLVIAFVTLALLYCFCH